MTNLQKYLGWVQRYLYQVELGPLPQITASLSIDQDWPLDVRQVDSSWVTIAGTVQTAIYAPGAERHGLVFYALAQVSVAMAANESMILHFRNPQGPNVALAQVANLVGLTRVPLIGARIQGADAAGTGIANAVEGIRPVYVPAGGQLQIDHLSVPAATNVNATVLAIERPRYYPLRLP